MNPAHRTARFWCAIPAVEVPDRGLAIVTACNPHDRPTDDETNRRADAALAAELDRLGWRRFRVIGGSPDGAHQEPGWGVDCGSMAAAIDLGRRWGQVAVFWVEQEALHLVDCHDGSVEALGSWSGRTRFDLPPGSWRIGPPAPV
jgi:hypothetical protein